MRGLLFAGLLVGCASANVGPSGGDPDASSPVDTNTPIDGPITNPVDAAPVAVTLQQTTDTVVAIGNSVACGNSANGGVPTDENSWYRVFSPAEANITNTLVVNQVTFAAETSSGSPTVQVKVGTYSGTITDSPLDLAKITSLASAGVTVPPTTTGESIPVPITATIPPNTLMIVEVNAPSLNATVSANVYIGTTISGFSHTSYIRAPACGLSVPQTVASINFPTAQAIITVSGTH